MSQDQATKQHFPSALTLDQVYMMTSTGSGDKDHYTIAYWTPVAEGGLDDEITVLMALDENEVAEGYRLDDQWFYSSNKPTEQIPSHWADLPRHPMDTAP